MTTWRGYPIICLCHNRIAIGFPSTGNCAVKVVPDDSKDWFDWSVAWVNLGFWGVFNIYEAGVVYLYLR
eukprot:7975630-Pyramimonas_sp.AAC.1